MEGLPRRDDYVRYLLNVYNYAQHSPVVIAMAASRCMASTPEPGRYLLRHAAEEIGHEQWALSDLLALGISEGTVKQSRPTPSCAAMIGFEYYIAGMENPLGLFGWLYALESLGGAVGTLISEKLRDNLPAGESGVYFLRGHGEADHDHAADLEEQITRNISKSEDLDDILYVAEVSSVLYMRLVEESTAQ
jgi:pyrroloquinoline quinone (PQQ) biosynthesis protein C